MAVAIFLPGCARRWEPFSTPAGNDNSVIFPLSVGRGLVEVEAEQKTYEMDGEVLRALMIVANDLFPPTTSNLPCMYRREAHRYRFTRRDDVIFVYVDENLEYCGRKIHALHSGAKYAIGKDGRILRRIIDGMDDDDRVWRLKTPDGGAVTVVAEPGVVPDWESLETPDGGVLKIVTEPVNMPDVMIIEPIEGERAGPEVRPGTSLMPLVDAGYGWKRRDRGSPDAGWDGGIPDAGQDGGIPGEDGK